MSWTREWPTEPGRYWFYGRALVRWDEKSTMRPRLNSVELSLDGTVRREGMIWHKCERGKGLFCKVKLPQLPNLESPIE